MSRQRKETGKMNDKNVMTYKYVAYLKNTFFYKSDGYGLARFWQYLVQV